MRLTARNMMIGGLLVVLLVCGGLCLLTTSLLGSGDDDNNSSNDTDNNDGEVASNRDPVENTGGDADLGNVIAADSITRDGCASGSADSFDASDSIYVVAENSSVDAGTSVFVRLYHDDEAIEDAPEIRADQNYDDTCINFVFNSASGFERGEYEAQFFVNGNAADSVRFEVR